jgi:hypothetical protein
MEWRKEFSGFRGIPHGGIWEWPNFNGRFLFTPTSFEPKAGRIFLRS